MGCTKTNCCCLPHHRYSFAADAGQDDEDGILNQEREDGWYMCDIIHTVSLA